MKIYVRINKRLPHQQFFRCGYKFGKTWTTLDVDKATALRLKEEQMLDVSDTRPEELPEEVKPAKDTGDTVQPANTAGTAAQKDAPDAGQVTGGGDGNNGGSDEDEADDSDAENPADTQEDVEKTAAKAPAKAGKGRAASEKSGK